MPSMDPAGSRKPELDRLDDAGLGSRGPQLPRRSLLAALGTAIRNAFVDNAALKFIAFVLALTIFILVHSDESAEISRPVGVSYSQLEDRVLVSDRVDQVTITVRGSRRRIKRFKKNELDNIYVDLHSLVSGEFRIKPEMFDIPEGLELVDINPPAFPLAFEAKLEKRVPVVVDTAGAPARGYRIASIQATPEEVSITGAASVVRKTASVRTEELNLTGRTQSFREVGQPLMRSGFEFVGTDSVTVDVVLAEELDSRTLEQVAVRIRPAPGLTQEATERFTVEPDKVTVTLYGPFNTVSTIDAEKVVVYVELKADDLVSRREQLADAEPEPKLPGVAYRTTPGKVTLKPK